VARSRRCTMCLCDERSHVAARLRLDILRAPEKVYCVTHPLAAQIVRRSQLSCAECAPSLDQGHRPRACRFPCNVSRDTYGSTHRRDAWNHRRHKQLAVCGIIHEARAQQVTTCVVAPHLVRCGTVGLRPLHCAATRRRGALLGAWPFSVANLPRCADSAQPQCTLRFLEARARRDPESVLAIARER